MRSIWVLSDDAEVSPNKVPMRRLPRIQIATVADLMESKLPKLPPPQEIGGGFKRAAPEEVEQRSLL
jgi:hypothetical protein